MPRRPRIFSPPSCAPALSRAQRRARGAYYTPAELVRLVVDWTLGPAMIGKHPPRVLDPSCGAGEFAIEMLRQMAARFSAQAVRQNLVAVDVDAAAAAVTRERLQAIDRRFPSANVLVGNTLLTQKLRPESFDVVAGNPPYVNIRQLAKSMPRAQIDHLRQRYSTARGNFDLYALFIERALELLKPGGRCGLIIPGKWATLDYARQCRELLLAQTTIEQVCDLSDAGAFADAAVFPHVLVFQKQAASPQHELTSRRLSAGPTHYIRQRSLSAAAIALVPSIEVESRVKTQPLAEVTAVSCGTAGYVAEKVARRLHEAETSPDTPITEVDFITSGNIDRYSIRLGGVRYLKHDYNRPRLALNIPELTRAKRRLFAASKIVIAGLSRRLEAAWDERGIGLGVQVFALSDMRLEPWYLLALLNSKLLSYLFATRYAAKRLSGGYLAINKRQLEQLPIAIPSRPQTRMLSRLAASQQTGTKTDTAPSMDADARIDRLVYQLYQLNDAEIDSVEGHFATLMRRAA